MSEVATGTTTEWLVLSTLLIDHAYQRPLNGPRAEKMATELDLDLLGALTVSRRANGLCFILDGQHRAEALRAAGFADDKVPCVVHEGLTVEDEARIFHHLNVDRRRPHALDLWNARLLEDDPTAVAIQKMLTAHGLRVAAGAHADTVAAVGSIEKVYRMASPATLERVLSTMRAAWPKVALSGDVLLGIGLMLHRFGTRIDLARLVEKLAAVTQAKLLVDARTRRTFEGGETATNVAWVVTKLYDAGLRSNRVGPFELGDDRRMWQAAS